jgi:hypothetical protein
MVNQDGINGKEVKTLTLANPATLLLRFFIEPVKDWGPYQSPLAHQA